MIDQRKRKTLKLISGAGAGLGLASLPLAGSAAALASGASTAGQSTSPLQIEILAGNTTPGDIVIMRNNMSAAIVIDQFTPGIVVFKDSIIDLNRLVQGHKITIEPQRVLSATVAQWQLLAVPMFKEYLWADDSAIEHSGDTHVIRLDGVLSGRQAILSPSSIPVYN